MWVLNDRAGTGCTEGKQQKRQERREEGWDGGEGAGRCDTSPPCIRMRAECQTLAGTSYADTTASYCGVGINTYCRTQNIPGMINLLTKAQSRVRTPPPPSPTTAMLIPLGKYVFRLSDGKSTAEGRSYNIYSIIYNIPGIYIYNIYTLGCIYTRTEW